MARLRQGARARTGTRKAPVVRFSISKTGGKSFKKIPIFTHEVEMLLPPHLQLALDDSGGGLEGFRHVAFLTGTCPQKQISLVTGARSIFGQIPMVGCVGGTGKIDPASSASFIVKIGAPSRLS